MDNSQAFYDAVDRLIDAEAYQGNIRTELEHADKLAAEAGQSVMAIVNAAMEQRKEERSKKLDVRMATDGAAEGPSTLMASDKGADVAIGVDGEVRYQRMDAMNLASRISPEGCTAAQLINDATAILAFANGKEPS